MVDEKQAPIPEDKLKIVEVHDTLTRSDVQGDVYNGVTWVVQPNGSLWIFDEHKDIIGHYAVGMYRKVNSRPYLNQDGRPNA